MFCSNFTCSDCFFVLMEWENTGWHGYDFDSFVFLSLFLVINLDISLFEKRFLPHGSVLLYGLGQGFLDLGICGGIMTHHQRLMLQKEEEIRNLKETSQLETLCILL